MSRRHTSGRRYLLTCAITRYERCPDWDRPELVDDVNRIADLLTGDFLPQGARFEHVPITSDPATAQKLLDGLRRFATSPDRSPDDYVMIYITGHGEILENSGDYIILPADSDPDDPMHRYVLAADIVAKTLANTSVHRLLVLLDTCYSGEGGAELAREALRRITPPQYDHDVRDSGVVIVASTQPYQRALPGVFTEGFVRAARSLASAGNAAPTIPVSSLMRLVEDDPERPKSQSTTWHQVGMRGDEPAFLVNPRFRSTFVDLDLLEQERARHDEDRRANMIERFLPATTWFTGREKALVDIAAWMNSATDEQSCVVTGNAGSGKTALLGRLATMADPERRQTVPRASVPDILVDDWALLDTIYAGRMTVDQVRDRIASALGLRVESIQELIDGANCGESRAGKRVLLVDALDEAIDPAALVDQLINPILRYCRGSLRLLLGTRPHLLIPALLGHPRAGKYLPIDLDGERYADPESMRQYIKRILLAADALDSAYKPSGVFVGEPPELVEAIAEAVREAADKSFLVARIAATTESTSQNVPDPDDVEWRESLPRRAGDAMRRDLRLRLGAQAEKAADLLRPLAYAQANGIPWEDIWPRLATALATEESYTTEDLLWLRRAAGSYAVENVARGHSVYRLYHQALAEHLMENRDVAADQRVVAETLLDKVDQRGGGRRDWQNAHPYILAHLSTHAAFGGMLTGLLGDTGFLLAATTTQLLGAFDIDESARDTPEANSYRRAASQIRSRPEWEHPAYLQLSAHQSGARTLADDLDRDLPPGSWSSRWAKWEDQPPNLNLVGHEGAVTAVTVMRHGEVSVIATGSTDRTIRLWDLASGARIGRPMTEHVAPVTALASGTLDSQPVLLSGSEDGDVCLWNPLDGNLIRRLARHHKAPIIGVFLVVDGDREVVVSVCQRGAVRLFCDATGKNVAQYGVARHWTPLAATITSIAGNAVVLIGFDDGSVGIFDVLTGETVVEPMRVHSDTIRSIVAVQPSSGLTIITGADDLIVRASQFGTHKPDLEMRGPLGWIRAVTVVKMPSQSVVVAGSDDGRIWMWDLGTGNPVGPPVAASNVRVLALTCGEVDGRAVLVTGLQDGSAQSWDVGTILHATSNRNAEFATPVRVVQDRTGRPLVAVPGTDGSLELQTVLTGEVVRRPWSGGHNRILGLAIASRPCSAGQELAMVTDDGTVRILDVDTTALLYTYSVKRPSAVATGELDGRPVLVVGMRNQSVQVLSWSDGTEICASDDRADRQHRGAVQSVAFAEANGRPIVVSVCDMGYLCWWDARTGKGLDIDLPTRPKVGLATARCVAATVRDRRWVLLLGWSDGSIEMIDLDSKELLHLLQAHTGSITDIATGVLPGGSEFAFSGSHDGLALGWDLRSGLRIGPTALQHRTDITSVAATVVDGRAFGLSVSADQAVQVWDLTDNSLLRALEIKRTGPVYAVAPVSVDDAPCALSLIGDGQFVVWERTAGRPLRLARYPGFPRVMAAVGVGERSLLVAGGDDSFLRLWNVRNGDRLDRILIGHTKPVTAFTAFLNGERAIGVSGSADESVRVWDLDSGNQIGPPLRKHMAPVTALAACYLKGNPVAVSGSEDGTLVVWDLVAQKALQRWYGASRTRLSAEICAIATQTTADGLEIYAGCVDGSLWRVFVDGGRMAVRNLANDVEPGAMIVHNGMLLAPRYNSISVRDPSDGRPFADIAVGAKVKCLGSDGYSEVLVGTTLGLAALTIPRGFRKRSLGSRAEATA